MSTASTAAALMLALTCALSPAPARAGVVGKAVRSMKQSVKAAWSAGAGRREIKALVRPAALTTLGINDRRQRVRLAYAEAQQRFGVAKKKAASARQLLKTQAVFGAAMLTVGSWLGAPTMVLSIDGIGRYVERRAELDDARDRSLITASFAARRADYPISDRVGTFVKRSLAQQEQSSAARAAWAGRMLSSVSRADSSKSLLSRLEQRLTKAWFGREAGRTLQQRASDQAFFAAAREALK